MPVEENRIVELVDEYYALPPCPSEDAVRRIIAEYRQSYRRKALLFLGHDIGGQRYHLGQVIPATSDREDQVRKANVLRRTLEGTGLIKEKDLVQVALKLGFGGIASLYAIAGANPQIKPLVIKIPHDGGLLAERIGNTEFLARDFLVISQASRNLVSLLGLPSCTTVYNNGIIRRAPTQILEYTALKTMKRILAEGTVPIQQLMDLLIQIGLQLADLHDTITPRIRDGIAHRDLKPENIFIDEKQNLAILSDYDLTGPEGTLIKDASQNRILGTVKYMPNNVGEVTKICKSIDIYAFGVCLGEVFSISKTFFNDPALSNFPYHENLASREKDVLAHLTKIFPSSPAVAKNLLLIIKKATHNNPQTRYQDMRTLLLDLVRYILPSIEEGKSLKDFIQSDPKIPIIS